MDRDNIPTYIREVLEECYTDEGVHLWWNSRNALFDGRRPCDFIHETDGPETIYATVNRLADGVFS